MSLFQAVFICCVRIVTKWTNEMKKPARDAGRSIKDSRYMGIRIA